MNTERSEARYLRWCKSSYSGGAGGECVEVAHTPATIHIRDSKAPTHGSLAVGPPPGPPSSASPAAADRNPTRRSTVRDVRLDRP